MTAKVVVAVIAEVPCPRTSPVREAAPVPPLTTERVEVERIPEAVLPKRISPAVRVVWPVPPFATVRALVRERVPMVALVAAICRADADRTRT